jgi:ribonuclease-3 family protein
VSDYYAIVVSQVRAEAQSVAYKTLDSGDFLTDEERDVLRWGRNATGTSPKRVSQGGMTREIYREATAIECLVRIVILALLDAVNTQLLKSHSLGLRPLFFFSGWLSLPYRSSTVTRSNDTSRG